MGKWSKARESVAGPSFKVDNDIMRWIERPLDVGLRRVGASHDILSMSHTGWYMDDFCDETVNGCVYQLPAVHGATRYLYGYDDPHNDGAACLCMDIVHDAKDAARWGDSCAERLAEREREYQRRWQAATRRDDLQDEIAQLRKDALELVTFTRGLSPHNRLRDFPSLVRKAVCDAWRRIVAMRREISKLQDDFDLESFEY